MVYKWPSANGISDLFKKRFCLGLEPGAGTVKLLWARLGMEFKGSTPKQPSPQVENRAKADEVRMQEMETTPRHLGAKALWCPADPESTGTRHPWPQGSLRSTPSLPRERAISSRHHSDLYSSLPRLPPLIFYPPTKVTPLREARLSFQSFSFLEELPAKISK